MCEYMSALKRPFSFSHGETRLGTIATEIKRYAANTLPLKILECMYCNGNNLS